jgi:hypothetical protein
LRCDGIDPKLSKKETSMSQAAMSCPKCQGEMVRGYTIDRSHQLVFLGQWAKGAPKKGWWFFAPFKNLVNLPESGQTISIGAFRCQSCGFLESNAREEFAAK